MILIRLVSTPAALPDDLETLKAALLAERAARHEAEARASGAEAMVAHLKLRSPSSGRQRFGPCRGAPAPAARPAGAAARGAGGDCHRGRLCRRSGHCGRGEAHRALVRCPPCRRVRGPLPAHLPRERVVIPAPAVCPCCQGKLVKLGEDVTETLEAIPRQWKVIQTVREKFTCRSCGREDRPATGAVPSDRPRPGRRRPAGDGPLRQIRQSPAG